MKSSLKVHKFNDYIFEAEVWFFHQGMAKDVSSYITRTFKLTDDIDLNDTCDGWVHSLRHSSGRIAYVVWVKKKEDVSLLAHECFHLTCRIFRDRGVQLNFNEGGREEHFAYYHGALMHVLMGFMQKGKKK